MPGLWDQIKSKARGLFSKGQTEDAEPLEFNTRGVPRRLMQVVHRAYQDMQPFRDRALSGLRAYAPHYGWRTGETGLEDDKVTPIGKMRQFTRVMMHLLASGKPQALVTTDFDSLEAFAEDFSVDLNRHLVEIALHKAMSLGVLHSLYWAGWFKTGLAEGDEFFEINGTLCDPGKACTSIVHYNNAVIDVAAEDISLIDFAGDRYRMPKTWVQAMSEGEAEKAAESLLYSNMQPSDRVSRMTENPDDRIYDEVWCWDLYLPKQNLMCLYIDGQNQPLATYEWDGPEGGPYDILGYEWVAGEVLPSSPASALENLHRFINNLVRKIERQAQRAKEIDVFDAANEEDAERIKNAKDGELVGLINPDSVKGVKFGGPDPLLNNTVMWADQQFDTQSGGLDVLGGTEAMSETFRQDKLLHDSASVQVNQMRAKVLEIHQSIIKKHAWYRWTEPIRELHGNRKIKGTGRHLPVHITPEVREGDFLDYNFDVNPYSLRELTPVEQAALMMDTWDRTVMPNLPLLQAEGQVPSAVEYIKKVYELNGLDPDNLFISLEGTELPEEGGQQVPMPAQLKNTGGNVNTRVSVAGTSKKGRTAKLMASNSKMALSNGVAQGE